MSRMEEFEEARPLLLSIAHRMLSSASQAEEAVHQAWLHYEASPEQPASGREFLTVALTDICLDILRRARREKPFGPWFPGPGDAHQDRRRPVEQTEVPPTAVLTLLERLNPLERAVFVLREVFGCGPAQIASAVGCSESACHRMAAAASRAGDGGGTVPHWPRRIVGAEHAARFFTTIVPALVHVGVTLEPRQVGHRPGAVFRDRHGTVLGALALDILDGRIQTVRWMTGPHLPAPDAHAWRDRPRHPRP
ncbi:sigma factor-like helix-turn-helix DNA-binding protein [Streptomyces sp. NPDC051207]|uniref:sigma factor-like helix-turn-helix DNA-binding protein n=1 Tax=Streptomyces sp. NPDC051207 TaxID=3154641 RepID=UPI00342A91A7